METEGFLSALRFLTIVRTPLSVTAAQPDWLARSMKYFPIVGIGIGAASAIILLLAAHVWGPLLAALLAVATSIVITGALHEDGLADTADAFGGGWTIEKRLTIMKDSRIGTFGALTLGIGVALRVAALTQLSPWIAAMALVTCHAAARVAPAFAMNAMTYAGDTAAMKVSYAEAPVRSNELWFALISVAVGALPLVFMSASAVFAGILLGAILAAALATWSRRLIGGYTGDVLGAIEQLFEIGFLLGVVAVIR
jgi:adenosylcobinamide-GDP ribazoletransferase